MPINPNVTHFNNFSNYGHVSDTKVIHSICIFDLLNCATKSVTIKAKCNVYFDQVTCTIFALYHLKVA